VFNAADGAVTYIIIVSDISLKTRNSGLHSVVESLGIFSTTFTQCAVKAIEFAEIAQNNGHCTVQGHSTSPILVPIESLYDFLLVINSNLPLILHRFRVIAFDRSEIAIFGYPSCVYLPRRRGSPETISVQFV